MAKTNVKSRGGGAPTLGPPEAQSATQAAAETEARPRELTAEEIGAMLGEGEGEAAILAPTLAPPEAALAEEGVLAWQSDKRVNALWSINQTRNTWMSVVGIGWKRLFNGNDSSITALTMLAAHARQTNCRVDYRDEADGLVREIYVW